MPLHPQNKNPAKFGLYDTYRKRSDQAKKLVPESARTNPIKHKKKG